MSYHYLCRMKGEIKADFEVKRLKIKIMIPEKTTVGMIVTLLLLLIVTHFAAVNPIVRVTGLKSDSLKLEILSETEDWWKMFRHDLNHTGYSNSTVPTELCQWWNTTNTINSSVRSSPAIVDDKVFVGSSDNKVYVLNATTGKPLSNYNYTTEGAVVSSPTVFRDTVFVGSNDNRTYAWGITSGEQEWNFTTRGPIKSSPAIARGTVFFGSLDGHVYALPEEDPNEDGIIDQDEVNWTYWTASPIYSSPAVSGDRVFIGASDGRIYALNLTGRIEWFENVGPNCSSSPAIADGKVYIGSYDNKTYCLDASNGKHVWNFTTDGNVRSSPAIADGRVYVGSDDGKVYCLNASNGKHVWNFTTDGNVRSSPAIAHGKVFVGSGDNKIYVLNALNGSHIWNYTTGGPIYSSPAVARHMVFIGSDDNRVYAFGPKNKPPQPHIKVEPTEPFILQTVTFNGSESEDPDGHIVNCTWDFDDGTIMENMAWEDGKVVTRAYGAVGTYNVTLNVTDNHSIPHFRESNSILKQVTVQEAWPMYRHDWKHTGNSSSLAPVKNITLWPPKIGDVSSDEWMYSSPAVIDGKVYIGSTNGTMFAFDARNGSKIWNKTLEGGIHSSPAVADGMVFVGSLDGHVYALDTTDRSTKWIGETTGAPIYSSPAVAYNRVFIGSTDGKIYAFDKNSEGSTRPVWTYDIAKAVYSSPAVSDGKVYVGSTDKRVYALNATTSEEGGQKIWCTDRLSDLIYSSPAVAGGMVFIGTIDGKVYALNDTSDTNGGAVLWSNATGGNIYSSPAVAGGMVFIGSSDGIYALDMNGKIKWNKTIGSIVWSSPSVAEGKVFVGSTDGIYALHEEDGEEVWSYQTGGPFDSSPAVLNDTLYVASKNGTLYAFGNKTRDIAITEVIPSRNKTIIVPKNETITLIVTLENQGSFDETNITVTVYYFNTTDSLNLANSTVVEDLLRGDRRPIEIRWNTTDVAKGNYTISANATLAIDRYPEDNYFIGGNITIDGERDLNVTDVWPGCNKTKYPCADHVKNMVHGGHNVTIYVTVKNEGKLNETDIMVTAYWSNNTHINQTIGSKLIEKLPLNENWTVSIGWNTTGLTNGTYTIGAKATRFPSETSWANNNKTYTGNVTVILPVGDVNRDNWTGIDDIVAVAEHFAAEPCKLDWDPKCDINGDCYVGIDDIVETAEHFGEEA